MSVDGGRYLRDRLMKDIIHPTLYPQIPMYFIPIMLQRLLVYPVSLFFPRLANILPALTLSTAGNYCLILFLFKVKNFAKPMLKLTSTVESMLRRCRNKNSTLFSVRLRFWPHQLTIFHVNCFPPVPTLPSTIY